MHSTDGCGRAGAVAIAYVMGHKRMGYQAALRYVAAGEELLFDYRVSL